MNPRRRNRATVVLPTRVGMVRKRPSPSRTITGSPHTRGDGPGGIRLRAVRPSFSPHAWGWSALECFQSVAHEVLPTRVGMVRDAMSWPSRAGRSPHTRGDGPPDNATPANGSGFSPHAWGWSDYSDLLAIADYVLPTRVGMVRRSLALKRTAGRSPHTRGDGPHVLVSTSSEVAFSPHAWGWSDVSAK